jgi:hypothetical protein
VKITNSNLFSSGLPLVWTCQTNKNKNNCVGEY